MAMGRLRGAATAQKATIVAVNGEPCCDIKRIPSRTLADIMVPNKWILIRG